MVTFFYILLLFTRFKQFFITNLSLQVKKVNFDPILTLRHIVGALKLFRSK